MYQDHQQIRKTFGQEIISIHTVIPSVTMRERYDTTCLQKVKVLHLNSCKRIQNLQINLWEEMFVRL